MAGWRRGNHNWKQRKQMGMPTAARITNWQANDFGYLAAYDGDWHDAEEFSWR